VWLALNGAYTSSIAETARRRVKSLGLKMAAQSSYSSDPTIHVMRFFPAMVVTIALITAMMCIIGRPKGIDYGDLPSDKTPSRDR
jgi:hypothetical protein